MKNLCRLLVGSMLLFPLFSYSQGSTCQTAIPLVIDGVCRTYAFTNTMEESIANCSSGTGNPYSPLYTGFGRVIYFKFTTGAGQPVPCFGAEVSIDGSSVLEAVLSYVDCASPWGPYYQVVCFNDGNGYWAPNDRNTYGDGDLEPNTTYILKFRVGAGFNGNLTICARYNDPENVNCDRSLPLTTTPTWYENSCHPGDTIPAGDLCAQSLENTAWYTYTIQGNTEDMLNVSAINCDNFESDFFGYQLGIFTGNCGSLQSFGPCFKDVGGSLQFPLNGLPVGTTIRIAMDGNGSSNCRYLMWVGGAVVLPAKWGYFSGKAVSNGNFLKWSTREEINTSHFEILRSIDGLVFQKIHELPSAGTTPRGKEYEYLDPSQEAITYYKLKLVDHDQKVSYSQILKVERKNNQSPIRFTMQNPVRGTLNLNIDSRINTHGSISVFNNLGQLVFRQEVQVKQGQQEFTRSLSHLSGGMFYLVAEFGEHRETKPFIVR